MSNNNNSNQLDISPSASGEKELAKMAEEIKVIIRMRPLNDRETNPSFIKPSTGVRCWRVLKDHNAITQTLNDGVTPLPEKITGRTIFSYDKVFTEEANTKQVYDYVGREIVHNALEGRNGSLFAYGQTSSGKTYTMQGSSSISRCKGNGINDGFIHYAAVDLFNEVAKREYERMFKISASVIEVYNEEVKDLLVDPNDEKQKKSQVLKIREDPKKGIFVNATKKEASSLNKLLQILSMGEKNRIVARTTLNKRSSRSHLIFCVMIESKPKKNGNRSRTNVTELETAQVSTLNLIDLAGSESVRHRSSHSNEKRRKEGGNINKSLLTLSRVISALGQPDTSTSTRHIGYRDSKLTRVLQPSLSGNAKLAFVCCATASGLYLEETKSTLQFAQRIKHVKTASKINIKVGDKSEIIKRLQEELNDTKESLMESMDRVRTLENENKSLKSTITFLTRDRDRALQTIDTYEKKIKERELSMSSMRNSDHIGVVQSSNEKQGDRNLITPEKETSKKSTIVDPLLRTSGEIQALNMENNNLEAQVGFLSTVVEKLQGKNPTTKKEEAERNGMPSNIVAGSKKSIVSEVTEPSRYGYHVDNDEHEVQSSMNGLLSEDQSVENSSSSSLLSKGENVDDSYPNIIPQQYMHKVDTT